MEEEDEEGEEEEGEGDADGEAVTDEKWCFLITNELYKLVYYRIGNNELQKWLQKRVHWWCL